MKNIFYFLLLLFFFTSCASSMEYYATTNKKLPFYTSSSKSSTIREYIQPDSKFIVYNKKWKSKTKVKYNNYTGYIFTNPSDYFYISNDRYDGSQTADYGGKTILTGPRGGKYYINKNGNKTYVPRGKH